MQYRSPNAIPDQTGSIILSFDWTRAIDWIPEPGRSTLYLSTSVLKYNL